jgi:hypothetical protein
MSAFKVVLYIILVIVALLVLAAIVGAISTARTAKATVKAKSPWGDVASWLGGALQPFIGASKTGQQNQLGTAGYSLMSDQNTEFYNPKMSPVGNSWRGSTKYIPQGANDQVSPDLDGVAPNGTVPIAGPGDPGYLSDEDWASYFAGADGRGN